MLFPFHQSVLCDCKQNLIEPSHAFCIKTLLSCYHHYNHDCQEHHTNLVLRGLVSIDKRSPSVNPMQGHQHLSLHLDCKSYLLFQSQNLLNDLLFLCPYDLQLLTVQVVPHIHNLQLLANQKYSIDNNTEILMWLALLQIEISFKFSKVFIF